MKKKRRRKKAGSPLLFILLGLLVILLPATFVIAGSLPAAPVAALPSEASVPDLSSEEEPDSESGGDEMGDTTSEPPKVEFTITEEDAAKIAAIIEADKQEAASYIPPSEESSEPESGGESLPVSSSSLSKFERPPVYGQQVSVYFKDLQSGAEYLYDPDQKYFIASLIKAPYCMYIYQLASEGKADLNQIITVTQKDIMEGTGTLQKLSPEELPKDFTLQELLTLAIRESDNTAMKAMLRVFQPEDYLEYARGLGIHYPEDVRFVTNGRITARDAGVYLNALEPFLRENQYGPILREDMLHTRNAMIRSDAPVVRKYGWASLSFHDMAIVEGEHPYLLAILTDKDIGRQADYALFAKLSHAFEEMLQEKYAAAE